MILTNCVCIILENQGYQNWSQYKCCILGSMYTVHKKKAIKLLSVSNSLDPDQDRHSVGPDLGSDCLQRLSADDKSRC